ncbi:DUF3794 and LysM peptidoglycan-binding domain-containing protein [Clostridium botulinum]|uniref:DUF3794 and LysM peptidoglycan-binding domain-containing protein n=1 Tax=Clostridium botulinum TaxID=1491 RepID=UPI0004D463DA|nr:SPOCS domain-containing protein [Clostridium botulinum]KEI00337.1 peptidase M23B [Clostridium botulinum C/D str. BKT75002]KEI08958.1 peptidase M23B [Clostridium botulinum C/D str. BKT2873]QPW60891.1 DUF3794 domain-containing protein [Clostridium botulinum]
MAIELIKESIEYNQLLEKATIDNVIKEEYVIPDIQPDVEKILMLDAKPKITNKEVMQNKVYVEGEIKCNVLYLATGDEGKEVYNVVYTKAFSSYADVEGAKADMDCTLECNIEHIECSIINERKIVIEGIIQMEAAVYKKYEFEVIKDVDSIDDIQLLKNPSSVDKIISTPNGELISKAHIQVPMDKPEIGKVLNCDVRVHKSDVKLIDEKVQVEAFTQIQILYKAADTKELCTIQEDIYVNDEVKCLDVTQFMESNTEFMIADVSFDVKEDDLGENRIIDVEALVKSETKVVSKEEIDMIEDAYSPSKMLKMNKKAYELNAMLGQNTVETIVKENIDIKGPKPTEIIMALGDMFITDNKIVEDKVLVEGLLNVNILYKTEDENRKVAVITEEIPFSSGVDIPGAKIDMECITRVLLENLETGVEAGTIAVKSVGKIYGNVSYVTHKEFLVDIEPLEDEVINKKASITIYVVQDGDTLWKIAKRYCTTVEDLIKINDLESENINVGQKLIIPGRAVI